MGNVIYKIVIYLENNNYIYQLNNEIKLNINPNLTKETLYYGETKSKFTLSDSTNNKKKNYDNYLSINNVIENINMKLMNAINSDINTYNKIHKTDYLLEKFKCIGKENDLLIYLVKINNNIALNNFTKIDVKDQLYKKVTNIINQYKRKNRKSKKNAVSFAFMLNFKSFIFAINFVVLLNLLINNIHSIIQNNLEDKPGKTLGIIMMVINVLLLGLQFYLMYREKKSDFKFNMSHSTLIQGKSKDLIYENIKKNLTKEYKEFTPLKDDPDSFLICDEENVNFQIYGNDIKVIKEIKNKNINNDSKNILAQFVGERINSDIVLFNGDLLGMDSELKFENIDSINIKDVKYFNYISIDDAIYKNVLINGEKTNVVEGHKICLNPITGGLHNIKNSPLTNLIGINLIVEVHTEKDEYLLINRQSLYNDVNSNKFVPTSSGSLENDDYKVMQNNNIDSFGELLKIGMLRELVEECYIDIDFRNVKNVTLIDNESNDDQLQLLGFSRLINKAGKPDFFAKLVLKKSENDLYKLLDNFDIKQNEYILNTNYRSFGRKSHNLESNELIIVKKKEFIDPNLNINVDKYYSPQLQYIKYLLQNEKKYLDIYNKKIK